MLVNIISNGTIHMEGSVGKSKKVVCTFSYFPCSLSGSSAKKTDNSALGNLETAPMVLGQVKGLNRLEICQKNLHNPIFG